ncbi:MAG: hypothetical protein AB7G93_20850 [Bdellovibrionales bacterium]
MPYEVSWTAPDGTSQTASIHKPAGLTDYRPIYSGSDDTFIANVLKESAGKRVYLPPRTYKLSNGVILSANNTEIDGQGSTFEFSSDTFSNIAGFSIINSDRVYVHNLTVQWDSAFPLASRGRIYSCVNGGHYVLLDSGQSRLMYTVTTTDESHIDLWGWAHPGYHQAGSFGGTWFSGSSNCIQDQQFSRFTNGERVLVRHKYYEKVGILVMDSTNTTLQNISLHTIPGNGLVGLRGHGLHVNGMNVTPAPGQLLSMTGGFMIGSMQDVVVENSVSSYAGDDFINIYSYQPPVFVQGNSLKFDQTRAPFSWIMNEINRVGVYVKFLDSHLNYLGDGLIESVSENGATMGFSSPPPSNTSFVGAYNYQPTRIVIRKNKISNSFSRGILAKGQYIWIDSNEIFNITAEALLSGEDAVNFMEGPGVDNLLVSRNHVGSNVNAHSTFLNSGLMHFKTYLPDGAIPQFWHITNIKFLDNRFDLSSVGKQNYGENASHWLGPWSFDGSTQYATRSGNIMEVRRSWNGTFHDIVTLGYNNLPNNIPGAWPSFFVSLDTGSTPLYNCPTGQAQGNYTLSTADCSGGRQIGFLDTKSTSTTVFNCRVKYGSFVDYLFSTDAACEGAEVIQTLGKSAN